MAYFSLLVAVPRVSSRRRRDLVAVLLLFAGIFFFSFRWSPSECIPVYGLLVSSTARSIIYSAGYRQTVFRIAGFVREAECLCFARPKQRHQTKGRPAPREPPALLIFQRLRQKGLRVPLPHALILESTLRGNR